MQDLRTLEKRLATARLRILNGEVERHVLVSGGNQHVVLLDECQYSIVRHGERNFTAQEVLISKGDEERILWHMTFWGYSEIEGMSNKLLCDYAHQFLSRGRKQLYDKDKILGDNKCTEIGLRYMDTKLSGSCIQMCEGTETLHREHAPLHPLWVMRYRGGSDQP